MQNLLTCRSTFLRETCPKILFILKAKLFLNKDLTDLEHLAEFGTHSKFTINIGDLTYGLEQDLLFDSCGTNNKCVTLRLPD